MRPSQPAPPERSAAPDPEQPDDSEHPGGPAGDGGRSWRAGTLGGAPLRRRRSDLVAIALITAVVVVGAILVVSAGDEAATTLRTAARPLTVPPPGPVPTSLTEAWRADSPASATGATPIGIGPVVVTAGPGGSGGQVVGRDPVTGAEAWSYTRPGSVCTLGGGFGMVLAVFRTEGPTGPWCSDVASFTPATGARGPARNADLREGTRLLADRDQVTGTGPDYLEAWRYDLVATTEIGRVPTPVQPPDVQQRSVCTNGSVAVGGRVIGALERCPGEDSDRLTFFAADPASAEKPEERGSVLLGVRGARLVAVNGDRAAVAAPDGTLRVVTAAGQVTTVPLGPAAGPTTDPPGLATPVRAGGPVLLWWTGTATVALDPVELRPRWTVPGTIGPGAPVPGTGAAVTLLVPVPSGLAVVDAATGVPRGLVPVARAPGPTPVGVGVVGTTVLEQRGSEVVALRPGP